MVLKEIDCQINQYRNNIPKQKLRLSLVPCKQPSHKLFSKFVIVSVQNSQWFPQQSPIRRESVSDIKQEMSLVYCVDIVDIRATGTG